jgi:exodeoxyribonuclease-1
MEPSFFFYDLETSGLSTSRDQILQFGGIRTNLKLEPIGPEYNLKIMLRKDVLPSPSAIFLTGIDPFQSGITEAELARIFNTEIAQSGTIFVGYNNIRFDDEFIRYLNYRNLYDPYGWHYNNNRSRWDLMDLVRLTRALRPGDINWPVNEDGLPVNKLESLTQANKLNHLTAHDALSDVYATLQIAQLINRSAPRLFQYNLRHRSKPSLMEFLRANASFVYTSSHFDSKNLNTTIVAPLMLDLNQKVDVLVWDLRYDPLPYLNLSSQELAELWHYDIDLKRTTLPVKLIKLNHCPALAPLSTLDSDTKTRLNIDDQEISRNRKNLFDNRQELAAKLTESRAILNVSKITDDRPVDLRLYEGFINNRDNQVLQLIHEQDIATLVKPFSEERMNFLLAVYKARNFEDRLTKEELANFKEYTRSLLNYKDYKPSSIERYKQEMQRLKAKKLDRHEATLIKKLETVYRTISNEYGA